MEASGYLPCMVTGTDDSLQSRTRFVEIGSLILKASAMLRGHLLL